MNKKSAAVQASLKRIAGDLAAVQAEISSLDTNDSENLRYHLDAAGDRIGQAIEFHCAFLYPE